MLRLLALLLVLAAPLAAQPALYQIDGDSRFWIDGTATTGPYSCEAAGVGGYGRLAETALRGEVRVPVRAFDCGMSRMNRDFRDALLGEAHPEITFTLESAEPGEALAPGRWVPVRATGTLRLAGTTRRVTLNAEGLLLSGSQIRLRGRHPLLMSDFGIEPPSGLMGLVRANDRVVARFDLSAALR